MLYVRKVLSNMTSKARDYTPTTIKRLFLLSCNQCAAPNCNNSLEAKDNLTIIAKICHIEAASPDGPRYNPIMSDDDRRDFNNLILLCDECHSIIDNKENEDKYPVELLKQWKSDHENKCRQNKIINKPGIFNIAINAIASIELDDNVSDNFSKAFSISKKIEYNSIIRNKHFIEEQSKYYGKINSLYSELEQQGSFKKEKLLRNINFLYKRIKSKYISGSENELKVIQSNADNIFEDVENELLKIIDKNQSTNDDIYLGLPIILVDAFMRCKILEEPGKL